MNVYALRARDSIKDGTVDEIRGVRVSPGILSEIAAWCGAVSETVEDVARPGRRTSYLLVNTRDGVRRAFVDDWIVREWEDVDDDATVSFRVMTQPDLLREYGPGE